MSLHRRCESCGALQDRADRLHLCNCEDQMNACESCRSRCRADNQCGAWFFEADQFPLFALEEVNNG